MDDELCTIITEQDGITGKVNFTPGFDLLETLNSRNNPADKAQATQLFFTILNRYARRGEIEQVSAADAFKENGAEVPAYATLYDVETVNWGSDKHSQKLVAFPGTDDSKSYVFLADACSGQTYRFNAFPFVMDAKTLEDMLQAAVLLTHDGIKKIDFLSEDDEKARAEAIRHTKELTKSKMTCDRKPVFFSRINELEVPHGLYLEEFLSAISSLSYRQAKNEDYIRRFFQYQEHKKMRNLDEITRTQSIMTPAELETCGVIDVECIDGSEPLLFVEEVGKLPASFAKSLGEYESVWFKAKGTGKDKVKLDFIQNDDKVSVYTDDTPYEFCDPDYPCYDSYISKAHVYPVLIAKGLPDNINIGDTVYINEQQGDFRVAAPYIRLDENRVIKTAHISNCDARSVDDYFNAWFEKRFPDKELSTENIER